MKGQGELFGDGTEMRHFAIVSNMQVITHNLLQLLKKVALPQEYAHAHPKRLRFSVFSVMGRLVSHAGRALLRIADGILKALLGPARRKIGQVGWDTS